MNAHDGAFTRSHSGRTWMVAAILASGAGALAAWILSATAITLAAFLAPLVLVVAAVVLRVLLPVRVGGHGPSMAAWVGLLSILCLSTAGAGALFAASGVNGRSDTNETLPALSDWLDPPEADAEELALLYQIRWQLGRLGVGEDEARRFFSDVVGGLRGESEEERMLALHHVLYNLSPEGNRLGPRSETLPSVAAPTPAPAVVPIEELPPADPFAPAGSPTVPPPPPPPAGELPPLDPNEGCGGGGACG